MKRSTFGALVAGAVVGLVGGGVAAAGQADADAKGCYRTQCGKSVKGHEGKCGGTKVDGITDRGRVHGRGRRLGHGRRSQEVRNRTCGPGRRRGRGPRLRVRRRMQTPLFGVGFRRGTRPRSRARPAPWTGSRCSRTTTSASAARGASCSSALRAAHPVALHGVGLSIAGRRAARTRVSRRRSPRSPPGSSRCS